MRRMRCNGRKIPDDVLPNGAGATGMGRVMSIEQVSHHSRGSAGPFGLAAAAGPPAGRPGDRRGSGARDLGHGGARRGPNAIARCARGWPRCCATWPACGPAAPAAGGRAPCAWAPARTSALPSPEELLTFHEAQRLVAEAVAKLEEPYRSTVLLCYAQEIEPVGDRPPARHPGRHRALAVEARPGSGAAHNLDARYGQDRQRLAGDAGAADRRAAAAATAEPATGARRRAPWRAAAALAYGMPGWSVVEAGGRGRDRRRGRGRRR